ncbi:C2 domain-containing protein [Kwoniella mangroviensis CBS 10435]|uniref:C2 domain-containing protein n=1 Tax=Kwoniella mangroviensis CBS 10435 TaxID=1331196 RepID=A0A1B9IXC6_9TREE|nr:C2 domain-containing protein [Kwoniella mangroviensis CBS 10435]
MIISPSSNSISSPVLVDLTPLPGEEDKQIFYPLDINSIDQVEKDKPLPIPPTTATAPSPYGIMSSANHQGDGRSTEFPELPPAPPSRVIGQGYSANNPVPTVQQYKEDQKQHEADAQAYADIVERRRIEAEQREKQAQQEKEKPNAREGAEGGAVRAGKDEETNAVKAQKDKKDEPTPGTGANEKSRLMEQMNANQLKPTERFQKAEKGQRRVRDPITGAEVIVKDADPKDFDASIPATKGTNALYHAFPPPRPVSVDAMIDKLKLLQYVVFGSMFVIWLSVSFGSGFFKLIWRSILCGTVGFVLMTLISLVERGLDKEIERVRQDMGRQRGEAFSPPLPESVEWLNGLIKLIWGLIDPALFISVADMVEDILQQSLPGFVDAVRITDLGQGSNPLRITSIRALPDQPGDEGYPKSGWINQGNEDIHSKDTAGKDITEDEAGDYYNFEVAFSYAALPGQGAQLRAKNIHLLIEFFLGLYDWLHIPIPIWIQVEQIFGVVRLRVQFIPEPPFVRNLTFALCGVPAVEVSAIPMSKHLPNVLDLPFVSSFVKMGIAAGTAELAVPKSMTLNIQELLSGAAVGDTRAIGVFLITIHHCEGLSAQDNNGSSDPYVVLAYAKFGKPLYSTRIILEDLNPVFEETAVLLLTMDEVKAKEDLAVMLWDSDKMSADDLVGRVQVPVEELMLKPNEMRRREDKLMGFEDANDMPGKIVWSIGYFEKAPLIKDLERGPTVEEAKATPDPPKTAPEMEMLPQDAAPNPAKKDLPPPPPDVQKTKPDPKWPSGVLSIILHQVNNLERQNLEGASGDREGEAGQDTDQPSEQSENLPSGYGEFLVNDDMVYKTRVKQYTTNPYFEAGTEVFVRDVENTVVRVVIRDSRLREADPILGIISVRLSEVFAEASSVTQVYALTEGVGFGKANISFAFRGMQTTLPKNMRGWDTGTLEVSQVSANIHQDKTQLFEPKASRLRVVTSEKVETLPKKDAEVQGNSMSWDLDLLRLPVYSRYQSSVVFEIGKGGGPLSALGVGAKPDAVAVLWMQDLTDDVEQQVKLPILVSSNIQNLKQNAINDQTKKFHDFEIVGELTARLKLDSGLDEDHETIKQGQSRRHALEAHDHIEGEAEIARKQARFDDDGVIDKNEQKQIDRAHKRQLESRGRGLAQVKAYRSAKWMMRGVKDRIPGQKKTRERE